MSGRIVVDRDDIAACVPEAGEPDGPTMQRAADALASWVRTWLEEHDETDVEVTTDIRCSGVRSSYERLHEVWDAFWCSGIADVRAELGLGDADILANAAHEGRP